MNPGVFTKSWRELLMPSLMLGLALALVQALLAYVLPTFAKQIVGDLMSMPFLQNFIRGLVGAEVTADMRPETFGAIAWVHPVSLAILWAHAAIAATRFPAGEVDRGTIDVLLGLPVSRRAAYISDTLAWLSMALVVLALAVIGNTAGASRLSPDLRPDLSRVAIVLVNLLAMYAAIGSLAYLCASLASRRGWAIGTVFALVVASFLLNYLAQFWKPAERLEFLSVLRYYRPLFVIRDGVWPWSNIATLASAAAVLWITGLVITSRRDLATT